MTLRLISKCLFLCAFYYKTLKPLEVSQIDRDYLKQLIFNRYSHLNKTQAVLQCANDLGVSRNVIYNIFKYQLPSEEVLGKFGKLLDIDYNKLFKKGES